MATAADSPRAKYRKYSVLLRIIWILILIVGGIGFHYNTRVGFEVLMGGFSILAVVLWLRDNVARRMEQRRKPVRLIDADAAGNKISAESFQGNDSYHRSSVPADPRRG
jgi:hypothetical protein